MVPSGSEAAPSTAAAMSSLSPAFVAAASAVSMPAGVSLERAAWQLANSSPGTSKRFAAILHRTTMDDSSDHVST